MIFNTTAKNSVDIPPINVVAMHNIEKGDIVYTYKYEEDAVMASDTFEYTYEQSHICLDDTTPHLTSSCFGNIVNGIPVHITVSYDYNTYDTDNGEEIQFESANINLVVGSDSIVVATYSNISDVVEFLNSIYLVGSSTSGNVAWVCVSNKIYVFTKTSNGSISKREIDNVSGDLVKCTEDDQYIYIYGSGKSYIYDVDTLSDQKYETILYDCGYISNPYDNQYSFYVIHSSISHQFYVEVWSADSPNDTPHKYYLCDLRQRTVVKVYGYVNIIPAKGSSVEIIHDDPTTDVYSYCRDNAQISITSDKKPVLSYNGNVVICSDSNAYKVFVYNNSELILVGEFKRGLQLDPDDPRYMDPVEIPIHISLDEQYIFPVDVNVGHIGYYWIDRVHTKLIDQGFFTTTSHFLMFVDIYETQSGIATKIPHSTYEGYYLHAISNHSIDEYRATSIRTSELNSCGLYSMAKAKDSIPIGTLGAVSLIYTPLSEDAVRKIALNAVDAYGAKVIAGFYTGNGNSNSSNPNTLTFEFTPRFVLIYTDTSDDNNMYSYMAYMIRGTSNGVVTHSSATQHRIAVTWTKNSVSWYGDDSNQQLNTSGNTYRYIAIG